MIAQLLPFAALLQGVEVLHAAAVELDGTAVALAGEGGIGKSTLALNVRAAGARFLTDDVLAVEQSGAAIIANPGVLSTKLRRQARPLVAEQAHRLLHSLLVDDGQEALYEVEDSASASPLGVVCMLKQSTDDKRLEVFEASPDPWQLLASTFNLLVQTPDRLRRQLEICTSIADQAHFLNVGVPSSPGPEAARQLTAEVRALL